MKVRSWHSTRRTFGRAAAALIGDRRGAVGIEYGLIAALIAVGIIGSLHALGLSVGNLPLGALITALVGAIS